MISAIGYRCAARRAGAAILRAVLLIALLLGGTVPDGMMRVAEPGEGLRLVLCTPEGTKEVWLAEDGKVTPVDDGPADDGEPHDPPVCVQVTFIGPDGVPPEPAPVRSFHSFTVPWRVVHQVAHRPALTRPQLSRAPPVPA